MSPMSGGESGSIVKVEVRVAAGAEVEVRVTAGVAYE